MFVDFFSLQNRRLAAEAEAEAFNKMAHTDIMTGLSNRRRCEEEFAVFAKSKSVFGIISFDLNDLKKTNDNYGHEAGDKLLTDFSNLLKSVFSEDCMVCRTGGDEFIATIPDAKKYSPESIPKGLEARGNNILYFWGKTIHPAGIFPGYASYFILADTLYFSHPGNDKRNVQRGISFSSVWNGR